MNEFSQKGFQGIAKIYTFVISRKKIMKVNSIIRDYHEQIDHPEIQKKLENMLILSAFFKYFLVFAYVGFACLVFIYPFVIYLLFGERILHFGFEIPGIDWQASLLGYGINFMHHSYQIFVVSCGILITNYMNFFFFLNVIGMYIGLGVMVKDFQQLISRKKTDDWNKDLNFKIIEISKAYVEIRNLMDFIESIFSIYYLVEIGSLIFQSTVTLFAIVTVSSSFFLKINGLGRVTLGDSEA
jgi:hypothetical protein